MERSTRIAPEDSFDSSLIITWHATEYAPGGRGANWYWSVTVVGLLMTLLAFYLDNILFAFIALLGMGVILLYGSRPPQMLQYTLSAHGLRVDRQLFPYDNLETFWIHNGASPIIMIKSKRAFMPMLSIPLVGIDAALVREFLLHFLKEEHHQIPFSEHISRAVGF